MNRRVARSRQPGIFEQFKSKIEKVDWREKAKSVKTYWLDLPKLHRRAIPSLAAVVIVLLLIPVSDEESAPDATEQQAENTRKPLEINTTGLSEQTSNNSSSSREDTWEQYTVKGGDTLAQVFRANSLPMADLNALVKIEGLDKPLSKIREGQLIRFKLDDAGKLDILQLESRTGSVMFFRLSDGSFGRSK
ncbi:LysM-like peptidoglycan-binding domain-containing protein [Vibrio nigripulchritudo]|uniref:LysM-like peptidoglycan-binding domain-containing protein n=1 Tax=Vibrio nigripulchritudo TaxID=28173 RepID=UPI0024932CFC|nr:LysM-like peptidoglycan-binding domain-containing protein [Vibrio nigripulchritudo]BDU35860.1 peptidoglycan-binding protein LysM [Vibrio nigripulchritudo]BDU41531.1 peptidoglycan-binding protein LysM [Vibrio nigripulchritudo]